MNLSIDSLFLQMKAALREQKFEQANKLLEIFRLIHIDEYDINSDEVQELLKKV